MWDRLEWGGPVTQEQIESAMTRWAYAWEHNDDERNCCSAVGHQRCHWRTVRSNFERTDW